MEVKQNLNNEKKKQADLEVTSKKERNQLNDESNEQCKTFFVHLPFFHLPRLFSRECK